MRNIKWREPNAVRRARAKQIPWRRRIVTAAMVGTVLLIIHIAGEWLFRGRLPRGPWVVSIWVEGIIAIALVGGCLGVILQFVNTFAPSIAIVSSKGINRNEVDHPGGMNINFWSWDQIGRLAVEPCEIGGKTFRVLQLYGKADEPIGYVGLSGDGPLDDLEQCLTTRGLTLDRSDVVATGE
ncbi:MAG TPA: hypothetical protein VHV77_07115 [Pirellulales bacterium]|nr:hypothetical protein [Pirellulales bacterium]